MPSNDRLVSRETGRWPSTNCLPSSCSPGVGEGWPFSMQTSVESISPSETCRSFESICISFTPSQQKQSPHFHPVGVRLRPRTRYPWERSRERCDRMQTIQSMKAKWITSDITFVWHSQCCSCEIATTNDSCVSNHGKETMIVALHEHRKSSHNNRRCRPVTRARAHVLDHHGAQGRDVDGFVRSGGACQITLFADVGKKSWAWSGNCFPAPFFLIFTELGFEDLKISSASIFSSKCQRKDTKKVKELSSSIQK